MNCSICKAEGKWKSYPNRYDDREETTLHLCPPCRKQELKDNKYVQPTAEAKFDGDYLALQKTLFEQTPEDQLTKVMPLPTARPWPIGGWPLTSTGLACDAGPDVRVRMEAGGTVPERQAIMRLISAAPILFEAVEVAFQALNLRELLTETDRTRVMQGIVLAQQLASDLA